MTYRRLLKRWFDVIAVLVSVPITIPITVLGWAMVRASSRGPGFFGQTHVGRDGEPFTLWKLRSMRDHADGPLITIGDDVRITRVGRVLRRTKLDELPQLWNVLRGDMSLVGPRPEVPEWVAHYPDTFSRILRLRPGITDLASVVFFDEAKELARRAAAGEGDYDDVLRTKLEMNLTYVEHSGPRLDLAVLLLTLASFLNSSWAATRARRLADRLGQPQISEGPGAAPPMLVSDDEAASFGAPDAE